MMPLAQLVELSSRVRATSSKKEKVALIANLLRTTEGPETSLVALYLTGTFPQGRVGIGWRTIASATSEGPAEGEPLTLGDVDRAVGAISEAKGPGSAGRRVEMLRALLARADRAGRRFLAELLLGELRQGALEGLVQDAVARAFGVASAEVRQAAMLSGDLGEVARAARAEGAAGLARFSLRLLRPVAPMLASPADDVGAALERLGEAAFEYKLDGARLQVHRSGDEVRVFTRQLQDVTGRVPEVVEWARTLPIRELVVEGEAIALRPDGRPQPFQVTMRRLGRTKDVAAARQALPLSAFFFDCLFLEGEGPLLAAPYRERMERLAAAVGAERRLPRLVTGRPDVASRFLAQSLAAGHEGVMAKSLAAPYVAGQRGLHWLKLKSARTLDLVVLAADWGSGRRRGWLSNLHLGARDAESGQLVMLGKTFKGLTDVMLRWQTERLLALETGRDQWTVRVRPELVVEIAFSDVQESPRYPAGLALRFARVKRHRTDKPAGEADTVQTVRAIFEQQRA
jgi:ATP-dependent DNA ligase I